MRIQPITNNQQSFKAVNQKYFAWAKEDITKNKEVTTEWIRRLGYDVYLFKKISHQDAIDTIEQVKKTMIKKDECLDDLLSGFILTNPNQ